MYNIPEFNTGWSPEKFAEYQAKHSQMSIPEFEFDDAAFQQDLDKSINWTNRVLARQERRAASQAKREANKAQYGNSMGMSSGLQTGLKTAGSLLGGMSGNDLPEQDKAVREGIRSAIGSLGPWGAIISAASGVVDGIGDLTGTNLDTIDLNAAERAGVKGGAVFNKVMNMLPGNSMVWGMLGGDTNTAYFSSNARKVGAGYGGSIQAMNDAQALGNKRMLFGRNKANKFIDKANRMNEQLTDISLSTDRMNENVAGQMMSINDQLKFSGHKPGLTLNRKGGTIPELESVRIIMSELQSNKQNESSETQKFQLGGKMNMIVTGALHARKHNLEELNPVLEGEITKKGIPVITFNEGGEVDQQLAEVEQAEIIMTLDATKTIEDYYKEYMDADTNKEADKAALECGKFLVDQILKNTDDPDKLIKKTK